MIVKNQYPICEFDTNKNPIIHPTKLFNGKPSEKMCNYLLEKGIGAFL